MLVAVRIGAKESRDVPEESGRESDTRWTWKEIEHTLDLQQHVGALMELKN